MGRAKKEESAKWIQGAVPDSNKGLLREKLGAKKGHDIPAKKLDKASHSKNPTLRKEAIFAETMKHLRK